MDSTMPMTRGAVRIDPPRPAEGGGGLVGLRAVPDARGAMVGPFALLVRVGPLALPPGFPAELDVRPHPHVGMGVLATLFAGSVTHRDGLGATAEIGPGDVSWMVAGSGLVHSERLEALRERGGTAHGLVAWVALPEAEEDCEPVSEHHPAATLPVIEGAGGARGRLLAGTAHGAAAPARLRSPGYLAHWELPAGATLTAAAEHPERAVHLVSGAVEVAAEVLQPGATAIAGPGTALRVRALAPSTLVELGGTPLGVRYLWWNFLASRPEGIAAAKAAWAGGRLPLPPDDRQSFIPLPADEERPLLRLGSGPDG
jgi:redox-sensitive bicupin YhaK (pirin superfamily)